MNQHDSFKEVEYVEHHMHHKEFWYAKKAVQTATEWGVVMDGHLAQPYRAISGNGTWGADPGDEALVLGTADVAAFNLHWGDFNRVLVVANSSNSVYLCRIAWGTGTLADAIAAGQYSEFPYFRAPADNIRKVMECPMPRVAAAVGGLYNQLWIQCQNATDNATIDFFVGMHGYDF
jgi:hypothetical protein